MNKIIISTNLRGHGEADLTRQTTGLGEHVQVSRIQMVILLNMFRYLEYEGYIGEHVQVSRIQRVIL